MKQFCIAILITISTLIKLHSQNVEQIISRHTQAIGGKSNIEKIKNILIHRKLALNQVGATIKSQLAIADEKLRIELFPSSVSGASVEYLVNGLSFKKEGDAVKKQSSDRRQYLSGIIKDFPSPLLHGQFKFVKNEQLENKKCSVLEREDGNLYWLNAESYLIEKSLSKLFHNDLGWIKVTSLFDKHQNFEGIIFPTYQKIIEYNQVISIENIQFDVNFKADFFNPKNIKLNSNQVKVKTSLPSPDEAPQSEFEKTKSYYSVIEKYKDQESLYKDQPQTKQWFYDLYSTALANAGLYKEALKERYNINTLNQSNKPTFDFNDFEICNALDEVELIAENHQAIFINEAHHVPQHRAFTHELLQKLYDKGYRYFAAEALTEDLINPVKQQNRALSYLNEPEYADLIRTAISIGFKIISYEQKNLKYISMNDDAEEHSNSIKARELAQAENLKRKIFDKDPMAKVVVHAGYDHIFEKEHYGYKMMAAKFKEITGLDPLTIDQVGLMEKGDFSKSNPSYLDIVERFKPLKYSILKGKKNEYWVTEDLKGKVDLQIIHPKTIYDNYRPKWKILGGLRQNVEVNFDEDMKNVMAEVYLDTDKNGVPIDRFIVKGETDKLSFYLPKGSFKVLISDSNGKILKSKKIKVE